MGEISTEPSMEDILSSIKRIIAEEGEPAANRSRRSARPLAPMADPYDEDELGVDVLELKDALRAGRGEQSSGAGPSAPVHAIHAPEAVVSEARGGAVAESPAVSPDAGHNAQDEPRPILSRQAAQASRGALDALSRLVVRPEASTGTTLDDLVREMLRPMLRDWLDSQLPGMVEKMVAREIERISGG